MDDVTGLWVLRLEDGAAFPITDGRANSWSPSWLASPGALLFVSNLGGGMDLWQQRLDTSGPIGEPTRLTVGVGVRDASASTDGRRIIYSKGRRVANVWRVSVADRVVGFRDAEQLTFDQALIEFVDVSPDRSHLVVSSDLGGNQDVWVFSADGAAGEAPRQLTEHPTADWGPTWSPDGQQIAFYSYRAGQRPLDRSLRRWLPTTAHPRGR